MNLNTSDSSERPIPALPEKFPFSPEQFERYLQMKAEVRQMDSQLADWILKTFESHEEVDPFFLDLVEDKGRVSTLQHLEMDGAPVASLPELLQRNEKLLGLYKSVVDESLLRMLPLQNEILKKAQLYASSTESVDGYTDIPDPRYQQNILLGMLPGRKSDARRHRLLQYDPVPFRSDNSIPLTKELRYTREPEGSNAEYGVTTFEARVKPAKDMELAVITHFNEASNIVKDLEFDISALNVGRQISNGEPDAFEVMIQQCLPQPLHNLIDEMRRAETADMDVKINLLINFGNIFDYTRGYEEPSISFSIEGQYIGIAGGQGLTKVNRKGSWEFNPNDDLEAARFVRTPRLEYKSKGPYYWQNPDRFNELTLAQYYTLIGNILSFYQGEEKTHTDQY